MTNAPRIFAVVLLALMCESVFAQSRSASPTQLNAINGKFTALGIPRTMTGGFDPLNGDVLFRFMTKERNVAFGFATTDNVLQISVAGIEGQTTRVMSSARITLNEDGSDAKALNATETQLAELSKRFNADAGKLDSLVLRLNEKGALAYDFISGSGSKSAAVINP